MIKRAFILTFHNSYVYGAAWPEIFLLNEAAFVEFRTQVSIDRSKVSKTDVIKVSDRFETLAVSRTSWSMIDPTGVILLHDEAF